MNLLRLSLNLLRRDWRAGKWRVLLAVGSIATIVLFADRVRQALQQEATADASTQRGLCRPSISDKGLGLNKHGHIFSIGLLE